MRRWRRALARDGPAPSEEQLTRLVGLSVAGPRRVETPTDDLLAPWAEQIYEWLTADRLQVTRIQELLAGRGCRVSYTSLRRFIQAAGLAEAESGDGPDGRERTRRCGGDGLRPSGSDGGPGDGSVPGGLGADHRPVLLAAQLRLAYLQPEARGRDRGVGGSLGLLRGRSQLPGDHCASKGPFLLCDQGGLPLVAVTPPPVFISVKLP